MSTREEDIQELKLDRERARSSSERKKIDEAGSRISKESEKVKSMREALIKARRQGNTAEVRDINEFVRTHKDYQNE